MTRATGAALLSAAAVLAGAVAHPAAGAPPRHPCAGSSDLAAAGQAWGTSETLWSLTGGPAANVVLSVEPTARGRVLGPVPGTADRMWRDLGLCVALPERLGPSRLRSLRLQLTCHAVWSGGPLRAGGDTWELEAWRPTVPRAAVVAAEQVTDPGRRCNWGPDTGPAYAPPSPAAATAAAARRVACRLLGVRPPRSGAWWARAARSSSGAGPLPCSG